MGLLIELSETQFGMGRPEDVEWYRTQPPGASPMFDQLRQLERQGYAELIREWDKEAQRDWVYAKITKAGSKRISELNDAGVQASDRYAELSFDEEGLPPRAPGDQDSSL